MNVQDSCNKSIKHENAWFYLFAIDKTQQYTDSAAIPKPPPFLADLTKQDKQNNNIQSQNAAVQTAVTVHAAKHTSGN